MSRSYSSPHRFAAFMAAVAVAVACASPAAGQTSRAAAVRGLAEGLAPEITEKLPRLRSLMRDGIDRDKPFDPWWRASKSRRELRTIFSGSYDRHSHMAALWALMTWARAEGDHAARREISERFNAANLRAESAFVESTADDSPVRPYDQTWLVLLLAELERHADAETAAEARRLRGACESRLLAFAESFTLDEPDSDAVAESQPASAPASRARPRRPRAPSPWLSGAYASATWPLVVLDLVEPIDPTTRTRTAALVASQLRAAELHVAASAPKNVFRLQQGYDFFHVPALLALARRTAPAAPETGAPRFAPFELPPADPCPSSITLANCHRLGAEVSKTWPLAFDAGRGDEAARAAMNERLVLLLGREDAWDGDFVTTSHWVPQFVYFALWLAASRP